VSSAGDVTVLLGRMREGDARARDELFPLVYRDLEQIAVAYVQRNGATLEARGLVHELYLRLSGADLDARDRKHFYAIAALAMRQILVDRARRRRTDKRGGDAVRVTLSGLHDKPDGGDGEVDLLAVAQALEKLEALSERQARIVELRCLVGLTVAEVADALDISERTVHTDWRLARAWLTRELAGHG
jgi:RNA polymerase sigma factor (TIGR02999 family)